LNAYQTAAEKTAVYPKDQGIFYTALALNEEAGEYAGKVAKWVRKGGELDMEACAYELGDVLWQVSQAANEIGYSLNEIAHMNLAKLADRQQRGVLVGVGDAR
jgi:NTP pyrophosphatase (non-canonical NTP hydrolase)